jgi:hypothetical protein
LLLGAALASTLYLGRHLNQVGSIASHEIDEIV